VESLREKLQLLSDDPGRCRELGRRAQDRARRLYDWEVVTDRYEKMICDLTGRRRELRLDPGGWDVG
jgi:glycosyltransferase involved in cell wall biosynthesis